MSFNEITVKKGPVALYVQLYNEIKKLIINDQILDGSKLPTIRELSEVLSVNNVTVINAYKLLEKDGLIEKKVGSGSFVKNNVKKYKTSDMDFTGQDSNIDSFPIQEISESIKEILNNDGVDAFKYEESMGYGPLLDSLVNYFKFYNINTNSELIQIVSGGQQALDIISKALLEFGDTILSETPTYNGAIESFNSREARIVYINLLNEGLDTNELEAKLQIRKPNLLYVMPYNQKPTGITYNIKTMEIILDLASRYNFYIIEDDLGSELSKDRKTLKSMDTNDRVIYIKSFTQLFMPGLRLGCIITPEKLYKKILHVKQTTDISTPGLMQRGFANYLNKNSWKDYYIRLSNNLIKKIELTNSIIKNELLDLVANYNSYNDSNLFWFKLNKYEGIDLKNICSTLGVKIISGEIMGREFSNYFLINIKSIPIENIEAGLLLLKKSLITLYSK